MHEIKRHLCDLSLEDLAVELVALGEPSFRAKQIVKWVYQKRLSSFALMANIPKSTREKLAERFALVKLTHDTPLVSNKSDAVKFGFHLRDGSLAEGVILYDGKRRTACISSQLGCGLGCVFCETGKMGFIRNLTLSEILGQIIVMNDYLAAQEDKRITNVVFMGMGEALSNFEAFKSATEILHSKEGFNLATRRITVSTAGVVPSIDRLRESGLGIFLAVSLNTYSNEKRNAIMPINKRYPIEEVIKASERFARETERDVTFEYVVVEGENDTPQAVNALVKLLHGVPCKLNLIPVNPGPANMREPSQEKLSQFAQALSDRGLTPTVRKSRGRDISGACGQLAGAAQRSRRK